MTNTEPCSACIGGTICPICGGPMTNGWCFAERQPSHAACGPCEGTGFVLAGHAAVQIIESEDSA